MDAQIAGKASSQRRSAVRYERRQPERSVLYAVLHEHLESFLALARGDDEHGVGLPRRPHDLDVVLLPNLYGDILSDAAAALAGGLGLAASGCYADYAYFESAHGTAPDIAGKGIINPTATLLSAAMMLDYLGFRDAAAALNRAIECAYADGKVLTPDQGGSATTERFCQAVAGYL